MRRALILSIVALGVPSMAFAYGEPDENGSPNANERLLHVFTNQVRQAPHEWPDWDTSLASPEARGPLGLEPSLLAAARYHANDMAKNGCFSHESCDGTPFQSRVSRFFSGPAGENIYTGTGSVNARARTAMTGWMNSSGHRTNILRHEWNWLGTGFAGAGQIFYVQNFGQVRGSTAPPIPGGAYEDLGGGAIRVVANYFDPDGRAPSTFEAILGDTRVPMTTVVGQPGNQTLAATADLPADCQTLFFVAEDADGVRSVFPSTGALLVGAACEDEYTTERAGALPGEDGPIVIGANDEAGGCRCVRGAPGAGWLVALALPLAARLRRKRR